MWRESPRKAYKNAMPPNLGPFSYSLTHWWAPCAAWGGPGWTQSRSLFQGSQSPAGVSTQALRALLWWSLSWGRGEQITAIPLDKYDFFWIFLLCSSSCCQSPLLWQHHRCGRFAGKQRGDGHSKWQSQSWAQHALMNPCQTLSLLKQNPRNGNNYQQNRQKLLLNEI